MEIRIGLYADKAEQRAAELCAHLVRHGMGFKCSLEFDVYVITFTGGF